MVSFMKTTIDIPDALLERAKQEASRQGTTLRDLVERGLTLVVKSAAQPPAFVLRAASINGQGATEWQTLSADDRVAQMYEG